jgi:hypothetical protein
MHKHIIQQNKNILSQFILTIYAEVIAVVGIFLLRVVLYSAVLVLLVTFANMD